MRIELTYEAWEASVLPLNYARVAAIVAGMLRYRQAAFDV